jgi:hypothetical protein
MWAATAFRRELGALDKRNGIAVVVDFHPPRR